MMALSRLWSWVSDSVASGGFLAPAFAGDAVATWAPPDDSGSAIWLDAMQVRDLEPVLHPRRGVRGGSPMMPVSMHADVQFENLRHRDSNLDGCTIRSLVA
jgi:hypothetical protein